MIEFDTVVACGMDFVLACLTYDSQHRYSPGRLVLSAPYRVIPHGRLFRLGISNFKFRFFFVFI